MPVVTQPDVIEVGDFSEGGWAPSGVAETLEPSALPDVLNLILDRATGSLVTRPGYRRLLSDALTEKEPAGDDITSDHYIKQLYHYGKADDHYIICVVVKDAAEANNVQLIAINIDSSACTRIDTADVTWENPDAQFWFQSIDGTLYGGSRGNPMFSWDGTTYDDDAATPVTKEWADASGAGVNTATEYGRDNAWTGKEFVEHNGDVYMPIRDIKYSPWESGERYRKGDLVSRKANSYWRSYKCIDDHTSDATITRPDDGTNGNDYWKRVKLPAPTDEDGNTNNTWALVPPAAETSIGVWFADRLWLRFDGQGDRSRMQYSAPIKPERGEDIPNTEWNARDWAPGNDLKGQGGGWYPFNDGKHGGVITAAHPFGQYLLVFKRRAVWALSGYDDATWNARRVARNTGCVGSQAFVELDGLVYFLSDHGLHVTDGTEAFEVPGNEKVEQWFRGKLDTQLVQRESDGREVTLFKWQEFVGISIPDVSDSAQEFVTVFYDPVSETFWKTDLPVLDFLNYRDDGVEKYAFCRAPASAADKPKTLVYVFGKSNANDEDDDGVSATTYDSSLISWSLTSAWHQFGPRREERRIRRMWALLKCGASVNLSYDGYRNYSSSASFTKTTTRGASDAGYIEGQTMPDAHAVKVYFDGESAPATFMGYAFDTQPRRNRYHN